MKKDNVIILDVDVSRADEGLLQVIQDMESLKALCYEKKATSLFGGTNGESVASDDSSASGIVGGMFAGMGDMTSMLPDAQTLERLSTMITKLKESAAAWVTQTSAKIADKAVDLQIIALYAADYVKAFGAMIAQIAASPRRNNAPAATCTKAPPFFR